MNKETQLEQLQTRLAMCLDWYKEAKSYAENNGKEWISFMDFEENGRPSFILTELVSKLEKSEKKLMMLLPMSQWLKEYLEAKSNNIFSPDYSEEAKTSLQSDRPVMDWVHSCILRMVVHTEDYEEGMIPVQAAKDMIIFLEKTIRKVELLTKSFA